MNIFRLLFELFILYLAYKLVFEFILPVYKTTKQMKQKMSDIHQKMQQQHQQDSYSNNVPKPSATDKASVAGDYIDYEEIK